MRLGHVGMSALRVCPRPAPPFPAPPSHLALRQFEVWFLFVRERRGGKGGKFAPAGGGRAVRGREGRACGG